METIDSHLARLKAELDQARQQGDTSKVNRLETELNNLRTYQAHHPGEANDPTPLEVYCDLNPQAPECLVYDD